MSTVVSERKRTEQLVCDGCRDELAFRYDGRLVVTMQIGSADGEGRTLHFHRVACLRRWVLRFEV